jgi:hypothetical protein
VSTAADLPLARHAALSLLSQGPTVEGIRARVDAACRMMELAQTVADAEIIRCAAAVALADMAAAGDDLTIVVSEYAKTVAAMDYAKAARQQAFDELTEVRVFVPLSA